MMEEERHSPGFTLMEVLLAMAIGSMVLLASVSLLASAGECYDRVNGSVVGQRESRALINRLAADGSTALFHRGHEFVKSDAAWAVDRIGFLSLQPDDAQPDSGRIGDLCAVVYYVKDVTINGQSVRCVMRGFRDSRQTFAALGSDSVGGLFAAQDAVDEPIAFRVVSFESRPKSRDGSGHWVDWMENDQTGPEALEVRLIVAGKRLAAKLVDSTDWDGGERLGDPPDADRNRNLEIFHEIIRFGAHGIR